MEMYLKEGGSVSRYLQAVSIPVVDRKNCSDIYTSMGFPAIKVISLPL